MNRILMAALFGALSTTAAAMGPMMTGSYFPLVDGARYDYTFTRGPHASAIGVMHAGQTWAGTSGLTSLHMSFVCQPAVPCNPDRIDFYRMDADGMHWFGGNTGSIDDGAHMMTALGAPEWMLKNPVTPGSMMGPGMGYQNAETWQAMVSGMTTMMGGQSYTSSYQALALETVVTPAGTFSDALHVHEARGDGYARDVWYAPGVGVVRWMDDVEDAMLSRMTLPTAPMPRTAYAVEYYHAGLDHYFMTADRDEIAALDAGTFVGWQRTGMGFNVIAPDDPTGTSASPVCRYYGNPAYGLDTHFYSASPAECAQVAQNWPMQWTLESSNVFRIFMPDPATGACPAGTQPVYRSWNRRTDTNHRYTMDANVQGMMMNRGQIAEGYGNPPVAMCAPQ